MQRLKHLLVNHQVAFVSCRIQNCFPTAKFYINSSKYALLVIAFIIFFVCFAGFWPCVMA